MVLSGPKRHTQKTGDISESAVITRLLQCGYGVLTPYGQMHRYDLVIEDADGKFWRVQCKTGWLNANQSATIFAPASSQNYTVKKEWSNYCGKCKYFAVYVEALNKVYFILVFGVSTILVMVNVQDSYHSS